MLPTIVDRDCLLLEPRCPLPRHRLLGSGQRATGSGQRAWRWCLAAVVLRGGGQRAAGLQRETITGNNPFSSMWWFIYFRETKPKLFFPNSFSTMAETTPTASLVVVIPETSENPTCYLP